MKPRTFLVATLLLAATLLAGPDAGTVPSLEAPVWSASGYVATEGGIALSWWPVAGASSYKVLRSGPAGTSRREVATVEVPCWIDRDTQRSGEYEYTLLAVAPNLMGPLSKARRLVDGKWEISDPGGPEWLDGSYTSTTEMGRTSHAVTVTWKPVPGATGYTVYRRSGESDLVMIGSTGSEQTSHTDKDVPPDLVLTYTVAALDGSLAEGQPSVEWPIFLSQPRMRMGKSEYSTPPATPSSGARGLAEAMPDAAAQVPILAKGVDELWVIQAPEAPKPSAAEPQPTVAQVPVITQVPVEERAVAMKKVSRLRRPTPRGTELLWQTWNETGDTAAKPSRAKLNELYDLAYDARGNRLYVTVATNRNIAVLNADTGRLVRYLGPRFGSVELAQPLSIFQDAAGVLYVADQKQATIFAITPDGGYVRSYVVTQGGEPQPVRLIGVCVLGGNVFATDNANGKVVVFDKATGREVNRWGRTGTESTDQFRGIGTIKPTPDGNLAVADSPAGMIKIYTPDGKWVDGFGERKPIVEGFQFISGFTILGDGQYLVTDQGPHLVKQFDLKNPDRQYQADLANADGTGRAEMFAPLNIVTDGKDRIWITEGMTNRVSSHRLGKIYGYDGSGTSTGTRQPSGPTTYNQPASARTVRLSPPVAGRQAATDEDRLPGCGELRGLFPGDGLTVPLPLQRTEVDAIVRGTVVSADVTFRYHNPFASKIEAVYVFPLPQNAAVTDFVLTVGERKIRGVVREREQAERIYLEARRQGYVASLLTEERPNIFTQKVANIEPGKSIDVTLTYVDTVTYADGAFDFVFPTVVGPRFNPPGSRNGVGAVAKGLAGISGQRTEVQYLRPGMRSGHDIRLTLDLDAGFALDEIASPTHAVAVDRRGKTRAAVSIRPSDAIPNKDFVLRYRPVAAALSPAMMVERTADGGYFSMTLVPPAELASVPRTGQEMVFVLDTSGSMSGWPLETSKTAITRALKNLDAGDTFQIIRFGNDASAFASSPVTATPANIREGLDFVANLRAGGGTMMIEGIRAALDFPRDERRLRIVTFMTDGYIGNEAEILKAIGQKLGTARIFSFGIGSSVNRFMLDGLARVGKGAVAYITQGDSTIEAVDRFYDRVRHPALTGITVDWGGMDARDTYPREIPDLFVGRPLTVAGRFSGEAPDSITVRGRIGGEPQTFRVRVAVDERSSPRGALGKLWARARIADLTDRITAGGPASLEAEVRKTALDHGLVSTYTAFVAVDSSRVTEEGHGTTVVQPVLVPEGVRYDTTVQERGK
jgi:Ca-activated chloride channel family protein